MIFFKLTSIKLKRLFAGLNIFGIRDTLFDGHLFVILKNNCFAVFKYGVPLFVILHLGLWNDSGCKTRAGQGNLVASTFLDHIGGKYSVFSVPDSGFRQRYSKPGESNLISQLDKSCNCICLILLEHLLSGASPKHVEQLPDGSEEGAVKLNQRSHDLSI